MINGKPSQTALAVAALRAAHQVIEGGAIFHDPLAVPLMAGADFGAAQHSLTGGDMLAPVRLSVAARARAADDAVAAAVGRGVRQVVVLGAGLDSFAYRHPHGAALRVFEVDHPATQAWKLDRLASAGITIPQEVRHVPVDFETDLLVPALVAAGFDPAAPSFVIWLGVVYYLTQSAMLATVRDLAGLAGSVGLIVDYLEPMRAMNANMQAITAEIAARVSSLGETMISFFAPEELHAKLAEMGFEVVSDDAMTALALRYMPGAVLPAESGAAHVLVARKKGLLF